MRWTVIGVLLLAAPGLGFAQGNRAGTWEWSFAGIYQDSAGSGAAGGSSVDVDGQFGLGISFGYHLNNNFMIGADVEWLRPDYTAVLVNDLDPTDVTVINHELSQFNGRIKGTFHFTDGPLTPYVEAGFGWTYIDSNVADGPPITGCWWHPWWGYVCSNYYSTFSSTEFSYGGALGLRYQLVGGTVLKLSVNHYVLDAGSGKPDPELNAARLEIAWGF